MDWACESLIHRVSCGIGVGPLSRPSGISSPVRVTLLLDVGFVLVLASPLSMCRFRGQGFLHARSCEFGSAFRDRFT